jgi:hypothetical protein
VNVYPFIEAEKAQQRSVKRACELLKVSRVRPVGRALVKGDHDGEPSSSRSVRRVTIKGRWRDVTCCQ